MKEFFMFGIMCVISPVDGLQQCAYFQEDPIIYYEEKVCYDLAVKKVNEIGTDFTSKGILITELRIQCIVDNEKKNT